MSWMCYDDADDDDDGDDGDDDNDGRRRVPAGRGPSSGVSPCAGAVQPPLQSAG